LPITLREHVRQFSVVTGTTADGEPELDWSALAREGAAFAIYMGVGNAPGIRRNLLSAGADPQTPVVIVENGTRESERAFATSLQDLTDSTTVFPGQPSSSLGSTGSTLNCSARRLS
jgi:uroporphyrin-III C-methyltransferase/precorrin-2 dehydrogenase/sirohydrochlorin ferrochelatase